MFYVCTTCKEKFASRFLLLTHQETMGHIGWYVGPMVETGLTVAKTTPRNPTLIGEEINYGGLQPPTVDTPKMAVENWGCEGEWDDD